MPLLVFRFEWIFLCVSCRRDGPEQEWPCEPEGVSLVNYQMGRSWDWWWSKKWNFSIVLFYFHNLSNVQQKIKLQVQSALTVQSHCLCGQVLLQLNSMFRLHGTKLCIQTRCKGYCIRTCTLNWHVCSFSQKFWFNIQAPSRSLRRTSFLIANASVSHMKILSNSSCG